MKRKKVLREDCPKWVVIHYLTNGKWKPSSELMLCWPNGNSAMCGGWKDGDNDFYFRDAGFWSIDLDECYWNGSKLMFKNGGSIGWLKPCSEKRWAKGNDLKVVKKRVTVTEYVPIEGGTWGAKE